MTYQSNIASNGELIKSYGAPWDAIDAESAARMQLQNRFKTGLDIRSEEHTSELQSH